jgi:SDR family mycofactocin-dependent oxidoreductase
MMGKLSGQVAIVTGAARGQGRSHAVALAAEGAAVVAADIAAPMDTVPYPLASREDLDETVRLVEAQGVRALAVPTDIRDSGEVSALVDQAVASFGRVDILVANAGICYGVPIDEMTDAQWREMIDTNLTGTFWCMRAVLPHMRRRSYGRVIVTASGAGRSALVNMAHYTATKWAVIGLVKTFALETAGTGITANALAPTSVHTPMVENSANIGLFCPEIKNPTIEDMKPRLAALNPLGIPWLEPEAVTRALLYLALDDGYTTGTVLEINLGTSASRP